VLAALPHSNKSQRLLSCLLLTAAVLCAAACSEARYACTAVRLMLEAAANHLVAKLHKSPVLLLCLDE
jgi:hypothetical protein